MPRTSHSAFTLAEILLAVALIGLLGGLISGAGMLNADALESRPPDRVALSAIKRARFEAIERGREVSLFYDRRGFFLISDSETAVPIAHIYLEKKLKRAVAEAEKKGEEIDWDDFPNEVEVVFEVVYPELIDRGGVNFSDPNIEELRFYPDSTMTPSRIHVVVGDEDAVSFEMDPFCAAPKGDENER